MMIYLLRMYTHSFASRTCISVIELDIIRNEGNRRPFKGAGTYLPFKQ